MYWINSLNTWDPNGINLREVYEAYNWVKKEKTILSNRKSFFLSDIAVKDFSIYIINIIIIIIIIFIIKSIIILLLCYYYYYYYHYY